MSLVLWGLVLLCLSQSVLSLDPCTNYLDINEPLRSVNYIASSKDYDHFICDRLLAPAWYRFTSGAGGDLPTACPAQYHCGTHVPIWMSGSFPSVADGIVTRKVCGNRPSLGCCGYTDTIEVKNCGTFYVYNLKPLRGCSMAYCAGSRAPCAPDKWSATGFEPGCVDAYPKITTSPSLSYPIVKPTTFEFKCTVNFDKTRIDVGFDVTWLFDGQPDPNVPKDHITGPARESTIDQKYLVGHLGKSISCKVDSHFLTSPGRKSPGIASKGYWMGIKLSESRLVVGEHEQPKEVKMISTVPIVCAGAAAQGCHLEVYLEPNNHDFKTTTACTVTLKPTDWNPLTHQAVAKFDVLAERDFKNDKDKNLVMHFSKIFSVDSPPIFNNYQIPYLQVLTKDKKTSRCYCTGDPHCVTLDRNNDPAHRRHYNYYKVGEFLMYKSTTRPFEVQARTWQCGAVSCNCGVVAREGNDVVRIDMCHGTYGRTFPKVTIPNKGSFSQGTVVQNQTVVVQKHPHGTRYVISFPSGAQVTVTNSGNRGLNIYITAPEDDYGATQGLCGTFDGRIDNDLTDKNGHVNRWSTRPQSFVESWRVPIGSSLFDKVPTPDPKFNNDMYYCNCNQAKKLVDCRLDGKAARPALHTRCPGCQVVVPTKQGYTGRRRRMIDLHAETPDQSIGYFFVYGLLWSPKITDFPTKSGMTLADATQLCTRAIQNSDTIKQCVSRVGLSFDAEIEACVEDIKLLDDTTFVQAYIESAILACQETVLKDPSFYNNGTGEPPAFITSDLCPSDCSGHGRCVRGTCQCETGFIGNDCVIDSTKPPTLFNIVGTNMRNKEADICDVQHRPCQMVYVIGENIREHNIGKCHLEELEFENGNFAPTGKIFETNQDYDTMNDVICTMPTKAQVNGKSVVGYNISLSNDGAHYSNEIQAFIIDSSCMSCVDNGGLCSIKANTCLIDGQCRTANELKQGHPTFSCKPAVSNTQWTSNIQTTTPPPAPAGGVAFARTDIWTLPQAGCECSFNKSRTDCACCDVDACQCPAPNHLQCVQCGHTQNCGTPLQAPNNGVDGYTIALDDCTCAFNTARYDCACCQNNGCQCGEDHQNQCVKCGQLEQCGNKPWIFGPAFLKTEK